jgi:hypothetical protein
VAHLEDGTAPLDGTGVPYGADGTSVPDGVAPDGAIPDGMEVPDGAGTGGVLAGGEVMA